ncbi:hypothetical protein GCM10010123_43410 [Pilimelia anulata]|uniref:HTH cro/C1-type domain-containing protein n=1 Tax=Pilimelia anulata TaxID=53371 RepID=A0A8J3BC91_9ACTN|nr:hypothetical protein [Pilimelia anulata]GGK08868.1 hypothetical protein GCM10010123_43410 [Pilimelia anulata]
MARPERMLDPTAGPVQEFAAGLREVRRAAGNPGYRELAERTGYSPSTLSDAAGGRRLPGLAVVRAFVDACAGDTAEWERRWRAAVRQQPAGPSLPAGREEPPYRGLTSFDVADAGRFFGREALVATLTERARAHGFLAIVGDSGSGKSSVLRAGLLPALRAPDGDMLVITPGERPMDEHRARLVAPPALLAVDQFEELFTLCRDEGQRADFIAALVDAAALPGRVLLIALRPDFYGHCARYPRLAAALAGATVPIGPMTDGELTRAITAPARLTGLTVERALVTKVLADAAGQAGALPLISHALLETWRLCRGGQLTLAAYGSTGGLTGAIARTAETEYAALEPARRDAARDLLIRLTALGEGTADTRRRVYTAELDRPGLAEVIDRFARARLLVVGGDTVEIAHEALIGTWPRLKEWLTGDRDALRLHRRLTDAATAWDAQGREDGDLYRGPRLALAREWADRPADTAALNAVERAFLAAADRAERAERAAAARRARQVRRLNTALAVLLVLVLAGAGVALRQWRGAVTERELARSRQLAAEALAASRSDLPRALRLAVRSYRAAPTTEARGALLSLAGHRPYSGRLPHRDAVKEVAFSPDGTRLATAGQDGAVTVWDVAARREVHRLTGHVGAARAVAFHPGGDLLATGGLDGTVRLWHAGAGTAGPLVHDDGGRLDSVAFSPDGRLLASLGADGRVRLRRVPDLTPAGEFRTARGPRSDLAFRPDGGLLAVADGAGAVRLWDVRRGRLLRNPATAGPRYAVRFTADGTGLVTAGADGAIEVRDTRGDRSRLALRGHLTPVRALAVNPRDGTVLSGAQDGTLTVRDGRTGRRLADLTGNAADIYGIAVSPDGRTVASAGRGQSVLLWQRDDLPYVGPPTEVADLAVSGDDRTLAAVANARLEGGRTMQGAALLDVGSRDTRVFEDRAPGSPYRGGPAAVPPTPLATYSRWAATVWDADRGVPVQRVRAASGDITGVDLDRASGLLAVGTRAVDRPGGEVELVDVRSGSPVGRIARPAALLAVRFADRGRTLVAVDAAGGIAVVDVARRALRGEARTDLPVLDAAIRPGGNEVALSLNDEAGGISVRRVADGRETARHAEHTARVEALAYSPDGRLLATGGHDHVVLLHDAATGELLAALRGHAASVTAIAFDRAGRTVYSGDTDGTIAAWVTDPAAALDRVCVLAARRFPDSARTGCAAGP